MGNWYHQMQMARPCLAKIIKIQMASAFQDLRVSVGLKLLILFMIFILINIFFFKKKSMKSKLLLLSPYISL